MQRLFHPGHHSWPASIGLLVLRLAAGGLMIHLHGWVKFEKWAPLSETFADPLGVGHPTSLALAILGEVVAAGLITVGLATRLAALPAAATMAVAVLMVHGGEGLADQEHALLYLAPYVALAFLGAGRLSLDAVICRAR